MIDFESNLLELGHIGDAAPHKRRPARQARFRSRTIRPIRSGDDSEMGFLPLLAAAIPMVTSLAGSLLSKKGSKGGGPPPEAAQAQNVLDMLTKAIGTDEKKGETSIKDVIRNIVSTVPSPVMAQVKAAITEMKNAQKAGVVARDTIVHAVDAKFAPQLHALLAGLKASKLQRMATYEHKKLKAKSAYKRKVTSDLKTINQRLDAISRRLDASAIVQGANHVAILGGRHFLERLG